MAGSTPIYGFPYPESSDLVANYPALGEQLAEDIESTISGLPAAGLTLVSPTSIANSGGSASASGGQVTFTGVSSVSLNGVFSTTYENYRILFTQTGGTGSLNCRLRASGSDNTTSNYGFVRVFTQVSTAGGGTSRNGSATTWQLGGTAATVGSYVGDFLRPQAAYKTQFHINGAQEDYVEVSNGYFNATTQFDGLSIYPDAGSMTGFVRIYGYKNS